MDSFHGYYKDGTEPGTRDCRWYGLMVNVTQILLLVAYGFTLSGDYFPLGAIVLILFAIVTITADVYKPHFQHLSTSMVMFILLIDTAYVSINGIIIADTDSYVIIPYIFYTVATSVCMRYEVYIGLIQMKRYFYNHTL